MKEQQRAETEKRSSAQLGYFLAGLAILLVASACDAQTKQELATLKGHDSFVNSVVLPLHEAFVNSVAFSPDGKTLASGAGTRPSSCGWWMRGNEVGFTPVTHLNGYHRIAR